ncbi:MAG: hypothetical protein H6733_00950 [Alphaproteobacteria bacterium]|nr:hypothetical protein [Alphaproteobacteria bacterium]
MTRLLLPMAALALATGCWSAPHWPEAGPADRCAASSLASDQPYVVDVAMPDRTRTALAWVPPGPGPFDVVVNLHEFRAEPLRQAMYSGWQPFAQAHGVILVTPDGKSATWNAGPCCGRAQEQDIDDVAFLDALVARIDAVACTSGRVLATGIGNGGMMAERWACASDVPDAVVSVGGTLQLDACDGRRPIPYLHYHGGADSFIPADGSPGRVPTTLPEGRYLPVAHATAAWTARNGGGAATTTVDGALTCSRADGRAPTVSCVIAGGLDSWPGAVTSTVASADPLADATAGAWAWVTAAWDAAARPAPAPSAEGVPAAGDP